MTVHIVTGSKLLGDMLCSACDANGLGQAATYRSPLKIRNILAHDQVLLHCTESISATRRDIEALWGLGQSTCIILLTSVGLTEAIRQSFSTEVAAIIPDDKPASTLIGALAVVREGYRLFQRSPSDDSGIGEVRQRDLVIEKLGDSEARRGGRLLSGREDAILAQLYRGHSNKEIAKKLGICEATVKVHLRSCYRKIGARNRTQAAIWAARNGVV